MKKIIVLCLLLCISFGSWAVDNSVKNLSFNLENLPQKIVLIEPELIVKELSVGGVSEEVQEWSVQARQNVIDALDQQISDKRLFDKVTVPSSLTSAETSDLDEHVALYEVVGFNAFYFGNSKFAGWKHKKEEFDYTLGDGLKVLADKTDADAALFIVGADHISSGGRKVARVFAALFGVVIPASPTFLSVGLVDLKNGDLLWTNYGTALDSKDLRKPEDVNAMIEELFIYYPGRNASQSN